MDTHRSKKGLSSSSDLHGDGIGDVADAAVRAAVEAALRSHSDAVHHPSSDKEGGEGVAHADGGDSHDGVSKGSEALFDAFDESATANDEGCSPIEGLSPVRALHSTDQEEEGVTGAEGNAAADVSPKRLKQRRGQSSPKATAVAAAAPLKPKKRLRVIFVKRRKSTGLDSAANGSSNHNTTANATPDDDAPPPPSLLARFLSQVAADVTARAGPPSAHSRHVASCEAARSASGASPSPAAAESVSPARRDGGGAVAKANASLSQHQHQSPAAAAALGVGGLSASDGAFVAATLSPATANLLRPLLASVTASAAAVAVAAPSPPPQPSSPSASASVGAPSSPMASSLLSASASVSLSAAALRHHMHHKPSGIGIGHTAAHFAQDAVENANGSVARAAAASVAAAQFREQRRAPSLLSNNKSQNTIVGNAYQFKRAGSAAAAGGADGSSSRRVGGGGGGGGGRLNGPPPLSPLRGRPHSAGPSPSLASPLHSAPYTSEAPQQQLAMSAASSSALGSSVSEYLLLRREGADPRAAAQITPCGVVVARTHRRAKCFAAGRVIGVGRSPPDADEEEEAPRRRRATGGDADRSGGRQHKAAAMGLADTVMSRGGVPIVLSDSPRGLAELELTARAFSGSVRSLRGGGTSSASAASSPHRGGGGEYITTGGSPMVRALREAVASASPHSPSRSASPYAPHGRPPSRPSSPAPSPPNGARGASFSSMSPMSASDYGVDRGGGSTSPYGASPQRSRADRRVLYSVPIA